VSIDGAGGRSVSVALCDWVPLKRRAHEAERGQSGILVACLVGVTVQCLSRKGSQPRLHQ